MTTYLETDSQTLKDLKIFNQGNTSGILDLFNVTQTRGGENKLKQMFQQPLSDQLEIQNRIDLFKYFVEIKLTFPFEGRLMDAVDKYIPQNQKDNSTAQLQSLSTKDVEIGVNNVIDLFFKVREFIKNVENNNNSLLIKLKQGIEDILESEDFEPIFSLNPKDKLSYSGITAFDLLFRGKKRQSIKQLLIYLYDLDAYLAVVQTALQNNFVFPVVLEKNTQVLRIKEAYHPGLKNAVANDVVFDENSNLIFLTGANMAGKSTFLRMISTTLYIAHLGFPVAAKQMEFSVMDGIYTTINLPDNLGIGASHFYAEVLRLKNIAVQLNMGKSLFVVFDELFRGTNVKDAEEATIEACLGFINKKNSRFIISSHIVEAAETLSNRPGIQFLFLPTKMDGNVPTYTYTLQRGITNDRHGMIILRNEGILDILEQGKKI